MLFPLQPSLASPDYAFLFKKLHSSLALIFLIGVILVPTSGVASDEKLLIEDVTNAQGVKGLRGTFQIQASREAIWDLLTDYDRYTETFKRIHSLEVINEDEAGALVRFKIKVLFLSFDYTLQRDYERPYERLTWHRTEGDFRQITGSWEIMQGPTQDVQTVVFESFVDVGYMVPTTMVRSRAAKELETTVKLMRERLETG